MTRIRTLVHRHAERPVHRTVLAVAALAASLALGACGGEEAPAPGDSAAAARDGMAGMGDMAGMDHGAMAGGGMIEQMTAHMRAMEGAGPDSLQAMMATHRQMVANMIAQMNREMRDMHMQADAAWNASVDSLRQDLRTLPELPRGEFEAFMPAHRGRVTHLMEMHRTMMQDMRR